MGSIYWEDAGIRENDNCGETYAIFSFAGESLNPEHITSRLGLEQTFAKTPGNPMPFPSNLVTESDGLWAISSQDRLVTTTLDRHLVFLLDLLEPVSGDILEITAPGKLFAYFHCYWLPIAFLGGPAIRPETLRKIEKINAYLEIRFQ